MNMKQNTIMQKRNPNKRRYTMNTCKKILG